MISAERTRGLCTFLRKEMGIDVEVASDKDARQQVLSLWMLRSWAAKLRISAGLLGFSLMMPDVQHTQPPASSKSKPKRSQMLPLQLGSWPAALASSIVKKLGKGARPPPERT